MGKTATMAVGLPQVRTVHAAFHSCVPPLAVVAIACFPRLAASTSSHRCLCFCISSFSAAPNAPRQGGGVKPGRWLAESGSAQQLFGCAVLERNIGGARYHELPSSGSTPKVLTCLGHRRGAIKGPAAVREIDGAGVKNEAAAMHSDSRKLHCCRDAVET
ncbi:hypothetical protein ACP70R_045853 [Stipagrostis hirtigluma subsp. patula]